MIFEVMILVTVASTATSVGPLTMVNCHSRSRTEEENSGSASKHDQSIQHEHGRC